MEPFSVTCETCKARLKVRSASAIGQIHSCPRCESMVHILPPPGWIAGPSKTATAAVAVAVAPAAASATFKQLDLPSQAAADSFAEAASAALDGGSGAMDPQFESWANVPLAPVPMAAASPSRLANFKLSLASLKASPGILLGGGTVAAVAVVGILALALWPGANRSEQPQAAATIVQSAPAAEETQNTAVAVESEKVAPVEVAASRTVTPAPHEVLKPSEETVAAQTVIAPSTVQVAPVPSERTPISTTVAAKNTPRIVVRETVAPSVASATNSDAPRPGVLTIDPLDPLNFDPANLTLPTPEASVTGASITASSANNERPAVNSAASARSTRDAAAEDALKPVRDELPTISVRRGPPAAAVTAVRNPATALNMPIRSLNARAMRLGDFVEMMAQMTAVPVTLSPSALDMTGASPRRDVSFDVKDTTIEKLMREVLGKQRLDFVERGGQLIVVGKDAEVRRSRDYDVADLLNSGEKNAARIAELVERFVAPESWSNEGGVGTIAVNGATLHVEQVDQIHIGVLVLCERLRVARGLPPKSRYPADRLAIESPYVQLSAKLSQPTTFTFVPWTQLSDVVHDWQQRSGVTILVDWPALSDIDLAPATPISCSVIRHTWRESLDEILAPLGLTWWAVDGETIQITSVAAADRLQRVEVLAVPDRMREQFADNSALVATLQSEVREQVPATVRCEIEADGRHLIVLGSASVHKYLSSRLSSE